MEPHMYIETSCKSTSPQKIDAILEQRIKEFLRRKLAAQQKVIKKGN
jgi:hypothetical protein